MADQTNQQRLTQAAKLLQSVVKPAVAFITFVLPPFIKISGKAWAVYKTLPKNVTRFLTGFIFCFFGGLYPTLFAAIQAAEHGGRQTLVDSISALAEEAIVIIEESKKDDEKDEDNDGIKDVNEIHGSQYVIRKTKLVMKKMNPEKVDKAIASFYRVWLSVIAVLTVQFARTISLALTVSDFLRLPVDRFIAPTVQLAIPEGYKKWVPVVLGWITKSIAMSIAWYIQTIISAFSSALAGGLLMARAVYDFCVYRGYTLWGAIPPKHEDSHVDEVLSYVFAALGFYFQYSINFDVPFPFNLILFPLELAEWKIRWTITVVD